MCFFGNALFKRLPEVLFMIKWLVRPCSHTLKQKLTFLYILNNLDILFTFALLKTDLFYEANYLMRSIVNNPLLSILCKIILPGMLISYLILQIDQLPPSHLKLSSYCVLFVMLIYIFILSLHVYYTFIFFLH